MSWEKFLCAHTKRFKLFKKNIYLEIIKLNAHTNISVWFIIKQLHSKIKHTTAAAAAVQ